MAYGIVETRLYRLLLRDDVIFAKPNHSIAFSSAGHLAAIGSFSSATCPRMFMPFIGSDLPVQRFDWPKNAI